MSNLKDVSQVTVLHAFISFISHSFIRVLFMNSFYISLALGLPCGLLLAFYNPLIFMIMVVIFKIFTRKLHGFKKLFILTGNRVKLLGAMNTGVQIQGKIIPVDHFFFFKEFRC